MLRRARQRSWRRGRMPLDAMAEHAIKATGARLNPDWDHPLYPPDLPNLTYPSLSEFCMGHPMKFPASFAQTKSERHCLDRILKVLSHQNPDLEHCPLLVLIMALMLKFTDSSRAYAVGQAMIDKSRRSANTIWLYFPITVHGFIQAVSALQQLRKFQGDPSVLRPLLSGEMLAHFPLYIQLQILACYFAEGYKIMYRMAIVCMDECRFSHSDNFCYAELQQYCSNVSLDKQLKRMFRYRLRRSEIASFIESTAVKYNQRQEMDNHRERVHWPDIDNIRSTSHIISVQLWINIWAHVFPSRLAHSIPSLDFCTARDGYSYLTMLRKAGDAHVPCSVVLADDSNNVLGLCLPVGLQSGLSNGSEAVIFSYFEKFHFWRLSDEENENNASSIFCKLDNSLSFITGKRMILSISEDMSTGVANSVFFSPDTAKTSESKEFSISHIEIISQC